MDGHCLTNEQILAFSTALFQAERSQATVEKYLRSVQAFSLFLDGQPVTKDTVLAWKKHLQREENLSLIHIFNTLKATMVEYEKNSTVTVGNITIKDTSDAKEVTCTEGKGNDGNIKKDGKVQFLSLIHI